MSDNLWLLRYEPSDMPVMSTLASSLLFPEELLEKILKCLSRQSYTELQTLRNCTYVSKQFNRIAFPLVFEAIHIPGQRASPVPFGGVVRSWERMKFKAEVVKKLTLSGVGVKDHNAVELYLQLSLCTLLGIIKQLPSLSYLKLYGICLRPCTHGEHALARRATSRRAQHSVERIELDGVVLRMFDPINPQHLDFLQMLQPSAILLKDTDWMSQQTHHTINMQLPNLYMYISDDKLLSQFSTATQMEQLQLWDIPSSKQHLVKKMVTRSMATLRKITIGANLGFTELSMFYVTLSQTVRN